MTEAPTEYFGYAEVTSRYLALKAAVPTRTQQHDLAKKPDTKERAGSLVAQFEQFLALPGTLQVAGLRANQLSTSLFKSFDHEQYEELKILLFLLADIGTTTLLNGYMASRNRHEESFDQGIARMGQVLGEMKNTQRPVDQSQRDRVEAELTYFQGLHSRLAALKDRLKSLGYPGDIETMTNELINASDEVRKGEVLESSPARGQFQIAVEALLRQFKKLRLPF